MIDGTPAAGLEAPASNAAEVPPAADGVAAAQPGAIEGTPVAAVEGEGAKVEPAEGEAPAVKGAPEAYTTFVSPEGTTLDATLDTEFKDLAKSLNLSQEDAQKVVDIGARITHAGVQAQIDGAAAIREGWAAESKADKEFGGDKLGESLAVAQASMKATTTPAMQELLERSGLGNHPEFIRHFLQIAPAFSADKMVPGGVSLTGASKSTEKVLYPNNA